MGNNWSSLNEDYEEPNPDPWWPAAQSTPLHTTVNGGEKEEAAESLKRQDRGKVRVEELEAFKQELARKRALRHEALAALQGEMKDLRTKVDEERSLREKAEEERDNLLRSLASEGRDQKKDLDDQQLLEEKNSLQEIKENMQRELEKEGREKRELLKEKEKLMAELEEKDGLERQVQALKGVSEIGKEMLRIRELQVKELKKKLVEINISSVMVPPEDLRMEYEKQIENIRKLRTLYEERAAATLLEHRRELEREEARVQVLDTKLAELQKETEECKEAKKELEGKIEKLENTIQNNDNELEKTKDDLFSISVQNKSLDTQLKLINNLFSQMLVSPQVDLDRLTRLLKENHGLISDLTAKGDSNEVAALLVDLAGQVEKESGLEQEENLENKDNNYELQSSISSNLSKVWRVMVELLSHHQNSNHTELSGGVESCYKCVQTPAGPRSVISVSQTFLTLKDLILEKNRLVSEVGRLKTLNNHLEHRLGSQERRLSVVTTELRKTWGVVNKLKAQHKQLHTHEKILRYELQQKRCMLTELKEELENCKEKWGLARQKNTQTEEDWKNLRKEFALRKSRKESNSAESGYEDEELAQSPTLETKENERDLFEIQPIEISETEVSEEDIEHSDGNSFDTVIDLLDITCLENQAENDTEIPFVLGEIPPHVSDLSPNLLPLTDSEFTEGLDQIESEDLAAVLDVQFQNQLLGVDYNLSLPSSSGSSPIPTENDDFASSEMDVSEEDSSLNDNHITLSPVPVGNENIPESMLLFGSNASKNISRFMEGLFEDQSQTTSNQNLFLNVPSTSQTTDETETPTPLINNGCYQFPDVKIAVVLKENIVEDENKTEVFSKETDVEKTNVLQHQMVSGFHPPLNVLEENGRGMLSNETLTADRKSQEEILNEREDKLRKLEQQCRSLVSKAMSTSFRSEITLSNKLDELHLEPSATNENKIINEKQKTESQECQHDNSESLICISSSISESPASISTKNGESFILEADTKSTDVESSCPDPNQTKEEMLEARGARLKRLEDQCKSLFSKMSATSSRSDLIANKLDELHGHYQSSEQTTNLTCASLEHKTLSSKRVQAKKSQEYDKTLSPIKIEEYTIVRSPDLASESKKILNRCTLPGPSDDKNLITTSDPNKNRTPEEILKSRAERFKRLEEQCKSLVSKMTATSLRSEIISNKLDELHSCYGSSEDTSDNEEHLSSSRRCTPISSPRYNRKTVRLAEKDKHIDPTNVQNDVTATGENVERVSLPVPQSIHSEPENLNALHSDQLNLTPEEILQARAQRLTRLEEQCKSLFSQMSATSQRSDAISNKLEELHDQYGQPSTSEQSASQIPSTSTNTSRFQSNNSDAQTVLQNVRPVHSPLEANLPATANSSNTSSEINSLQNHNLDRND